MTSLSSSVVVCKQPSETLSVSMDFSNWLETSETINSPVVTSYFYGCDTTDLTITSETVVGQTVTMLISGGSDGSRYRINVVINTSGGEILEGDGILEVTDR